MRRAAGVGPNLATDTCAQPRDLRLTGYHPDLRQSPELPAHSGRDASHACQAWERGSRASAGLQNSCDCRRPVNGGRWRTSPDRISWGTGRGQTLRVWPHRDSTCDLSRGTI
jgi:hypothetical protein